MINTSKLQVTVAFKGTDSSDAVKEYAQKRSEKILKYVHHLATCHYVFLMERQKPVTQIHLVSGDFEGRAESHGSTFFESIDEATDKIIHQCRKHKEIATDHSGKGHHNTDGNPIE